MSHEFEDRENNLGDLPEPIARERRENYPNRPVERSRLPPDIAANARALEAQRGAPIGAPVMGAHVTSTYDARPINARDFIHTEIMTLTLVEGS